MKSRRGRFRRVVHHYPVSKVIVGTFYLDIETVHLLIVRLRLDLGDTCRHQLHQWVQQTAVCHIELTTETWQELVCHRRVHVCRD